MADRFQSFSHRSSGIGIERVVLGLYPSPGSCVGPSGEALRQEKASPGFTRCVEQEIGSSGAQEVGHPKGSLEMPEVNPGKGGRLMDDGLRFDRRNCAMN